MRIAFGIVSLIPKGGLQRDCLNIAQILHDRGHRITIFTSRTTDELAVPFEIVKFEIETRTNHAHDLEFSKQLRAAVDGRFDRVVGFNKLLDLEYLYCADPSVHTKKRNWLVRSMPRHRGQLQLEAACFAPHSRTHVLLLSHEAADSYRRYWNTPAERLTILPPSIDPARHQPHVRTAEKRASVRQALDLPSDTTIWLWIGTRPQTKGLDRAIVALQHNPECFLVVLGVEAGSPEGRRIWPQILRAGVTDRVRFLGYRDDVPEIMAAADLLVHPTRLDVTGQVVLEAIINGLPVITSEVCGFGRFVRDAGAGILLSEPFVQSRFEKALRDAMQPDRLASFSRNGISFGNNNLPMMGLHLAADALTAEVSAPKSEARSITAAAGAGAESRVVSFAELDARRVASGTTRANEQRD